MAAVQAARVVGLWVNIAAHVGSSALVTREELAKVSYLVNTEVGQREVELLPLWDGDRWCVWLPTDHGLRELHPPDAVKTDYVARQPASEDDICVPFIDIIWQRASWPEAMRALRRARDDVHNLGTSLAKIDHFFDSRGKIGFGVSAFVMTELEYLFTVSRSIFDLVHELVRYVWQTKVHLNDPARNKIKKGTTLSKSLADILLESGTKPRTSADLQKKFGFSTGLATAYAELASFFLAIREFRDAVVHIGSSPDLVVVTDRGFCVAKNSKLFKAFHALSACGPFNDQVSSLRPLLAHVAFNTINGCNRMVNGLIENISLAPELAPGYRIFIRGPHNRALLTAKAISEGGDPWWATPDAASA